MPHKPYWFRNLRTIRRWVASLQQPFIDRKGIEAIFQVSQTEAQRIMRRVGAVKLGSALVVHHWQLSAWLAIAARSESAAFEEQRVERVEIRLEQERRQLAARRIPIQPLPAAESIEGLPAGIRLKPGRLEIDFYGTEDLLKHLYTLAKAVMADYPRFQKICEGD